MCYNFTGYNVKPYIIFRNTAKPRRPESDMIMASPEDFVRIGAPVQWRVAVSVLSRDENGRRLTPLLERDRDQRQ
jgi:hypothetical protein